MELWSVECSLFLGRSSTQWAPPFALFQCALLSMWPCVQQNHSKVLQIYQFTQLAFGFLVTFKIWYLKIVSQLKTGFQLCLNYGKKITKATWNLMDSSIYKIVAGPHFPRVILQMKDTMIGNNIAVHTELEWSTNNIVNDFIILMRVWFMIR